MLNVLPWQFLYEGHAEQQPMAPEACEDEGLLLALPLPLFAPVTALPPDAQHAAKGR